MFELKDSDLNSRDNRTRRNRNVAINDGEEIDKIKRKLCFIALKAVNDVCHEICCKHSEIQIIQAIKIQTMLSEKNGDSDYYTELCEWTIHGDMYLKGIRSVAVCSVCFVSNTVEIYCIKMDTKFYVQII